MIWEPCHYLCSKPESGQWPRSLLPFEDLSSQSGVHLIHKSTRAIFRSKPHA